MTKLMNTCEAILVSPFMSQMRSGNWGLVFTGNNTFLCKIDCVLSLGEEGVDTLISLLFLPNTFQGGVHFTPQGIFLPSPASEVGQPIALGGIQAQLPSVWREQGWRGGETFPWGLNGLVTKADVRVVSHTLPGLSTQPRGRDNHMLFTKGVLCVCLSYAEL